MACGTGKTLTARFVAERLGAKRTLVLVPSLSLLAQTLREWTANASEDFDCLAVCSDDTVIEPDAALSSTSDLGFPVTTDADDIARFLRRRAGRRVAFSTYQSSPRIAEAYRSGRVPRLDLAVADEAHRCAGRVSSDFATILDGVAIPAERRLFMTATPRYFTGRVVREASAADFEVASMDDPATFGPVFHRLSFGEAIERDLLSDYQVAVIGVDDATYREWAERGRFVTLDGTAVTDARSLAGQIGLAKAMRRYGLHRAISFHSRVARARDFARTLTEVVRWMPADQRPAGSLWAQHVSGEMSTGQRTISLEHLRQLHGGGVGLLANARCLAEGVDVPTLDGVAFVDPRRSEVDIVQAVGRAIRKAENKTQGTIVIPVFIGADEDPEAALDDSAFKPVWDVIRALRAHDADLAEQLDSLRRELGRGASKVTTPPKIHLDLPACVGLDFASAFEVRLVEETTASWEFLLGLLEAFVAREGHCRVSRSYVVQGINLGAWCKNRRFDRKRGELKPARIAELDALGFVWDPFQDDFDRGLAELAAYVQAHGDARVPEDFATSTGLKLGVWCQGHRGDRKNGRLSAERIAALDALGFVWDVLADDFDRGIAELAAYVRAHGDARVPPKHTTSTGFKLGPWCDRRRQQRKAHTLTSEKIAALDTFAFAWDPFQEAFDRGLAELAGYVHERGDARVPQEHVSPSGFKLGTWCSGRRHARKLGRLNPENIGALDALGFVWDVLADDFDRGIAALAAYVQAHGGARVPQQYKTPSGHRLGAWCSVRRTDRKVGKLSAERIAALDALGFVWDARQTGSDPEHRRVRSGAQ
jgi:superfamily II DNA or RNA helicase